MEDVMIDFETLGTSYDAIIVQAAAAFFKRDGTIGEEFMVRMDPVTSFYRDGFKIDPETVIWWLNNPKETIGDVFNPDNLDPHTAMLMLNSFLRPAKYIWSHATFDFVLLMHHMKIHFIKPLFPHRGARDIRTLLDLAEMDPKDFSIDSEGIHHTALSDVRYQIKLCARAFKAL
uniref:3'-5' exoribonuclease Rv2179c-like domain-containing protein n=1 Tax=viral metagenome TaxID=1070528 RepID=A0A6M3L3A6_9ZZZZ